MIDNLPNRILWIALATALILAAAQLLVPVVSVLLLMFAGVLFGVFLNGISGWLANKSGLGYGAAYATLVTFFIAVLVGGFLYLGASFSQQLGELSGQLQSAGNQLIEQLREREWVRQLWPSEAETQDLATNASSLVPGVVNALQSLAWGLTGAVVIFFVGLYVAYDPNLYRSGLIKLVQRDQRDRAHEAIEKARKTLLWWLAARIISMTIIGVATAIGLWLLDVPLAFTLGVLAALLTFIPNIGPILAAIPQALLALQVSPQTALYVILLNIALQTAESYLVTPIVERYQVTLPPALTIFAQLIMTVMFGLIGVMMAAPLTAVTLVLTQTLYIRDQLQDPHPGELSRKT